MENMEGNSEKNWKIQKKSKLNSEKIGKIPTKVVSSNPAQVRFIQYNIM